MRIYIYIYMIGYSDVLKENDPMKYLIFFFNYENVKDWYSGKLRELRECLSLNNHVEYRFF